MADNLTYGVGLKIDASSFKAVKDDLKSNFKVLETLVKQFGKELKINPDADLSKVFAQIKKLGIMTKDIEMSGLGFDNFVDKGVLDRLVAMEKNLSKIEDIMMSVGNVSKETAQAINDANKEYKTSMSELDASANKQFPGTYAFRMGEKDRRADIRNTQQAIDNIDLVIKKQGELDRIRKQVKAGQAKKKAWNGASELEIDKQLFDITKQIKNADPSKLRPLVDEWKSLITDFQIAIRSPNTSGKFDKSYIQDQVNDIESVLESKRAQLKAQLTEYRRDQKTYESELVSNDQSLGLHDFGGGSAGQVGVGNFKLNAQVNEGEWRTKIQSAIKNIEASLDPIQLKPTFLKNSKNVEKDLDSSIAKISHQLNIDINITDNFQELESVINTIDNSIKEQKARLKNNTFRIEYDVDGASAFKSEINLLREDIESRLKNIPATIELNGQEEFLSQVKTLASRVKEEFDGLPVNAYPQLGGQMIMAVPQVGTQPGVVMSQPNMGAAPQSGVMMYQPGMAMYQPNMGVIPATQSQVNSTQKSQSEKEALSLLKSLNQHGINSPELNELIQTSLNDILKGQEAAVQKTPSATLKELNAIRTIYDNYDSHRIEKQDLEQSIKELNDPSKGVLSVRDTAITRDSLESDKIKRIANWYETALGRFANASSELSQNDVETIKTGVFDLDQNTDSMNHEELRRFQQMRRSATAYSSVKKAEEKLKDEHEAQLSYAKLRLAQIDNEMAAEKKVLDSRQDLVEQIKAEKAAGEGRKASIKQAGVLDDARIYELSNRRSENESKLILEKNKQESLSNDRINSKYLSDNAEKVSAKYSEEAIQNMQSSLHDESMSERARSSIEGRLERILQKQQERVGKNVNNLEEEQANLDHILKTSQEMDENVVKNYLQALEPEKLLRKKGNLNIDKTGLGDPHNRLEGTQYSSIDELLQDYYAKQGSNDLNIQNVLKKNIQPLINQIGKDQLAIIDDNVARARKEYEAEFELAQQRVNRGDTRADVDKKLSDTIEKVNKQFKSNEKVSEPEIKTESKEQKSMQQVRDEYESHIKKRDAYKDDLNRLNDPDKGVFSIDSTRLSNNKNKRNAKDVLNDYKKYHDEYLESINGLSPKDIADIESGNFSANSKRATKQDTKDIRVFQKKHAAAQKYKQYQYAESEAQSIHQQQKEYIESKIADLDKQIAKEEKLLGTQKDALENKKNEAQVDDDINKKTAKQEEITRINDGVKKRAAEQEEKKAKEQAQKNIDRLTKEKASLNADSKLLEQGAKYVGETNFTKNALNKQYIKDAISRVIQLEGSGTKNGKETTLSESVNLPSDHMVNLRDATIKLESFAEHQKGLIQNRITEIDKEIAKNKEIINKPRQQENTNKSDDKQQYAPYSDKKPSIAPWAHMSDNNISETALETAQHKADIENSINEVVSETTKQIEQQDSSNKNVLESKKEEVKVETQKQNIVQNSPVQSTINTHVDQSSLPTTPQQMFVPMMQGMVFPMQPQMIPLVEMPSQTTQGNVEDKSKTKTVVAKQQKIPTVTLDDDIQKIVESSIKTSGLRFVSAQGTPKLKNVAAPQQTESSQVVMKNPTVTMSDVSSVGIDRNQQSEVVLSKLESIIAQNNHPDYNNVSKRINTDAQGNIASAKLTYSNDDGSHGWVDTYKYVPANPLDPESELEFQKTGSVFTENLKTYTASLSKQNDLITNVVKKTNGLEKSLDPNSNKTLAGTEYEAEVRSQIDGIIAEVKKLDQYTDDGERVLFSTDALAEQKKVIDGMILDTEKFISQKKNEKYAPISFDSKTIENSTERQQAKLNAFVEQAKSAGLYVGKTKDKIDALQKQLNNVKINKDLREFNRDFDVAKSEFASLRTYSKLYDDLGKAIQKAVKLKAQLKSDNIGVNEKRQIALESARQNDLINNIVGQLKSSPSLYDEDKKNKVIEDARKAAYQSIYKSDARDRDKTATAVKSRQQGLDAFIEKAKQAGVYAGKLKDEVDELQTELNDVETGTQLKDYDSKFKGMDAKLQSLKNYNKLYKELENSVYEVTKLESQINAGGISDDRKQQLETRLREKQNKTKDIERQLKANQDYYNPSLKGQATKNGRKRASQEIAEASIIDRDKTLPKVAKKQGNLDTFIAQIKRAGLYTDEWKNKISALQAELDGVTSSKDLTAFNDKFAITKSEFTATRSYSKLYNDLAKSTQRITELRAKMNSDNVGAESKRQIAKEIASEQKLVSLIRDELKANKDVYDSNLERQKILEARDRAYQKIDESSASDKDKTSAAKDQRQVKLDKFIEKLKKADIYTGDLKTKVDALQASLNGTDSMHDIGKFDLGLSKLDGEATSIQNYNKLYDQLSDSIERSIKLKEKLNSGELGDNERARVVADLKDSRENTKAIIQQLKANKQLFNSEKQIATIEQARQNALRDIGDNKAKQTDAQIQQYRDRVDSRQSKYDEIMRTQNKKINIHDGMGGSGQLESTIAEYKDVISKLEQLQAKIKSNPALMKNESINSVFDALEADAKELEQEITSLQSKTKQFLSNVKNDTDIKPLADNVDPKSVDQLSEAMHQFAHESSAGAAEFVKFDEKSSRAIYNITDGKGRMRQLSVMYDEGTNSLGRYVSGLGNATTTSERFFNNIKHGFENVARYFISFGSIYEVINVVRQGVESVREIDGALTELKKVTSETDVTYDNFLQTASKTASTVGSTVQDITTMAANWARLGWE